MTSTAAPDTHTPNAPAPVRPARPPSREWLAPGTGLSATAQAQAATANHEFLVIAMLLGASVGMISAFGVMGPTPRGQLATMLFLPVPMVGALALGLGLGGYRLPGLVAVVVILAVGAYLRRFGPGGMVAAMVLFIGDFFGFFIHGAIRVSDLGWPAAEIGVGVLVAIVVRFGAFYPHPHKALARTQRSFEARSRKVTALALEAFGAAEPSPGQTRRVHRQLVRLNEDRCPTRRRQRPGRRFIGPTIPPTALRRGVVRLQPGPLRPGHGPARPFRASASPSVGRCSTSSGSTIPGAKIQQRPVGLLDPVSGKRPPGHHPDVGPGYTPHLPPHERVRLPHLHVGQCRPREVLGQVPLQDRPGNRELHRRPGQSHDRGRGPRLPPGRPVGGHRAGRSPVVDAADAGDAVRGRRRLPVQSLRPDQDLAAADCPTIPIGRMVLDRNPENFFAQIEQAAFEPADMVPGIAASPDKMLQGRLFSCPDTTGTGSAPNTSNCRSTQPLVGVHGYSRDGPMNFRMDGDPDYAPNSYGGSRADPDRYREPTYGLTGEIVRAAYHAHRDDTDFVQPGALYREVMSPTDREHLLTNVIGHATHGPGLDPDVAARVGEYWRQVDSDLGAEVPKALA